MPAIDSINSVAKDLAGQFRSLAPDFNFDTDFLTTIILPLALIVLGAVLIYDLYILFEALSTASSLNSRSLMAPKILQVAKDAIGLNGDVTIDSLLQSRSLESFAPILNGIQMAMDKYGHKQ